MYRATGSWFWRAENQLQTQIKQPGDVQRLFVPLDANDPLREEYSRAASAADAFIKLADENKTNNRMRPAVLYLGGLSKYSLGDNAGALQFLERLQKEFSTYKRDQYINDRDTPNPQYAVSAAAGVAKLIFYLRLQVALKDAPDAFASLQQITSDALVTLAAQSEYSHWRFRGQPDQRRAAALPSTLLLMNEAWDALLEKALQQAGATALRQWLRGLSTPGALLYELAFARLQNIDALIIKAYFAEAQNLVNQNNFDGARAKYRQIMAEYPDSDAATRAEAALPEIVPIAVSYYKAEGDKSFRPELPDQFFEPQTKAREYYEKMYNEDPNGPQADYALFKWAEALGTEGKIDLGVARFQELLGKFKDSRYRARATYLIGFFYGSLSAAKYDEAISWLKQVSEQYPDSPEAPEALWHMALFYAVPTDRFKEGLPYLEQLRAKYPESRRWKHTEGLITKFKDRIANGGSW